MTMTMRSAIIFIRPIILLSLLLHAHLVCAQQINVNGGFLSDSIKIGEKTAYYLTARYPSELSVLFPDSTFGFAPLEYMNQKYFATSSENGISTDSTIYFLNTFELDPIQILSLPVFILNEQDCTIYFTPADSIRLIELVANVPDSISIQNLPLLAETEYQKVSWQFNYLILGIGLALLIVIAIVVWIVFGKRIAQYFRVKKLTRKHSEFITRYNKLLNDVKKNFSASATEAALSFWKKYMEQLEAKPYTKLTTKETYSLHHDDALINTLKNVDMAIYGHNTSPEGSLQFLRQFADLQFGKRLKEVKHGK